jgi:guanylate kinase
MAQGMLLVLSGPSGAGKGTLGGCLLATDPSFQFSVSATTRQARSYEVEGTHYFFVSDEVFDGMVARDDFLENAVVHEHRYGTPRAYVEEKLSQGINVLLDVDVQGACAVMEVMPEAVTVFILPPSYEELARRLRTRNTDDPEEIARRLCNARGEIARMGVFRYAIVNDTKEQAFAELSAIVMAEKRNTLRYHPTVREGGEPLCP